MGPNNGARGSSASASGTLRVQCGQSRLIEQAGDEVGEEMSSEETAERGGGMSDQMVGGDQVTLSVTSRHLGIPFVNQQHAVSASNTLNTEIQNDASAISSDYASILASSARQALTAVEITLSKAASGSYNTELYPDKRSMHNMGVLYPNVTPYNDGQDEAMPVEENIDEIVVQANLVIKDIMGSGVIRAMSEIATILGKTDDAKKYSSVEPRLCSVKARRLTNCTPRAYATNWEIQTVGTVADVNLRNLLVTRLRDDLANSEKNIAPLWDW
ncbi:hypothetical protein FRC07_004174 [Ceratobasidium sp. 392]|nr:hypothetical protein FRC07_004174 [Ceratobasidium sp. 392]